MGRGVAHVPENRLRDAVFASMSVRENASATVIRRFWAGWMRTGRERAETRDLSQRFNIKTAGTEAPIRLALGWQPAEGRPGALASTCPSAPPARRADPRCRRHRPRGDLQRGTRRRRRRMRRAHRVLGPRRACRGLRSSRGARRRRADRHPRRRRPHPGAPDPARSIRSPRRGGNLMTTSTTDTAEPASTTAPGLGEARRSASRPRCARLRGALRARRPAAGRHAVLLRPAVDQGRLSLQCEPADPRGQPVRDPSARARGHGPPDRWTLRLLPRSASQRHRR